ncbi:MAG: indolepyruvate oxidoreductase subunit beta family protein [Burkholderiaceae bacterium]
MKPTASAGDDQPFSILIAALGGEGGGVLADWIVSCALARGLPVQATSVPGVAQRTGATSYYVELMRAPAPAGLQPVFALSPLAGRVDVVLASELLEAGRMIERGFVSPERTTLIAARHRVYTTVEKMKMGDGRFDDEVVHTAARKFARHYLSLDMATLAARHRTVISAVMFGALAGAGVLPWSRQVCEDAIRRGAVGVEASLAGFAAAFQEAADPTIAKLLDEAAIPSAVWAPLIAPLPPSMHTLAAHGVARLTDWQDADRAREYIDDLTRLAAQAATAPAPPDDALAEAARRLALWMSYEDVVRVADLKTRPERFARIRAEARARDDEIVRIVDYLKPGSEEIAAILPRPVGLWLRRRASRPGKAARSGRGMLLSTSHVSGYLALRLVARLRPLRRRSLRFHEESAAIRQWLAALEAALPQSPELALQIARLPRLLKGYGDTWARGLASYQRIFDTLVAPSPAPRSELSDRAERSERAERSDRPELREPAERAAAIRDAIDAALADPEGRRREEALARAGVTPLPPAPKPIVWMRKPHSGASQPEMGENSAPTK